MQRRCLNSRLLTTLLAVGLGAAGLARADDTPTWALSGYGTVGLAHSNERNADYTSSALRYGGAGKTSAWSPDVDSHLGAQLDATFDKRWSAVLQVVSEQNLENNYRPRVEWANLKFQATPELALRLGRIALPVFLCADYRQVGYAYPWVRPPVESYGGMPISSSDGIDATLRWNAGPVHNASQFLFGHDSLAQVAPVKGKATRIVGISNTSDWGALTVHATVVGAELTLDIGAPLFAGFDAFGAQGEAISADYAIDHKYVSIANIGASYDPGAWFVMGELSRTHTQSLLGQTRSGYVTAGLRSRAFTPYVTYSQVRSTGPVKADGLALGALPPGYQQQAAALNAGLDATIAASIPQQSTISTGLRWDVHDNIALKLQYDRVTPHHGSVGTLIHTTPGFVSDHAIGVTSVTLDFVY